jgi:hypothetical protein
VKQNILLPPAAYDFFTLILSPLRRFFIILSTNAIFSLEQKNLIAVSVRVKFQKTLMSRQIELKFRKAFNQAIRAQAKLKKLFYFL